MKQAIKDYQRIERALHYLATNYKEQPTLAEIANAVHVSEYHFQRLFSRWVGVSPKQFLQYLTVQHARSCLRADMSVLEATYDSGLSAPARLGEMFHRLEAMTPSDVRSGGVGVSVEYGFQQTPFGECLIAFTARGITSLVFCDGKSHEQCLDELTQLLPQAFYCENQARASDYNERIFRTFDTQQAAEPLSLCAVGTPFQLKVWEALLALPQGSRVSYQHIADRIDQPKAVRAVGTAIGRNPIALLIPCHRVIRSDGMPGGYRWGEGRKLALQGWESVSHAELTLSGQELN
ncbi:hypothetical protein AB833_06565 [Chromatiales bacterium (ex Bugula neritina AB1)]|nr:hypothetical protein AB833_06565 [Chromatiales bacterium (ex Bugula neritina AB1)]